MCLLTPFIILNVFPKQAARSIARNVLSCWQFVVNGRQRSLTLYMQVWYSCMYGASSRREWSRSPHFFKTALVRRSWAFFWTGFSNMCLSNEKECSIFSFIARTSAFSVMPVAILEKPFRTRPLILAKCSVDSFSKEFLSYLSFFLAASNGFSISSSGSSVFLSDIQL